MVTCKLIEGAPTLFLLGIWRAEIAAELGVAGENHTDFSFSFAHCICVFQAAGRTKRAHPFADFQELV